MSPLAVPPLYDHAQVIKMAPQGVQTISSEIESNRSSSRLRPYDAIYIVS